MQITVYVPKELEETIRGLSEENGQSIQQVLLSPWRNGKIKTNEIEKTLSRIESKLDALAVEPIRKIPSTKDIPEKTAADRIREKLSSEPTEDEIIKKAQAELEKIAGKAALFETSHVNPEGTPASVIEETYQKVVHDNYNEQAVLAEAQKKLEATKFELQKSIKTSNGSVKVNSATQNFFNPRPKGKK